MDKDDEFDEQLDPDAEIVALLLSEGKSDAEATLAIGRQAKWAQRRRRDDPRFVRRIEELKTARVAQAASGLSALLEGAVEAVERNLQAERPADQLQAARLVFDRFRALRAEVDMDATVTAMQTEMRAMAGEIRKLRATQDVEIPG